MWKREDHLARVIVAPAHLENKRVTLEALRRHQARREELIREALASAQEDIEPREGIIDRAMRYLKSIGGER